MAFEDLEMRVVVALYLVIVTAAGPWACCCTFTRLTAKVASANAGAPTSSTTHSCCKKHQVPNRSEGSSEDKAPSRPNHPLGHDCPCKQSGECASTAFAPTQDESRDGAMRALAGEFDATVGYLHPSHLAPTPHAVWPSSWVRHDGSFLSTEDLLHVLHILRC